MADEAGQAPDPLAALAAEEAAERQAAEEEAPTPSAEATPTEEPERLIAGRYKTVEEAEKALIEKDRFISQQGNEIGTYRQQLEQFQQQMQYQQPQPQQQQGQSDPIMAAYGVSREQIEAAYETDPVGTMDWMAEQKAQQRIAEYGQQLQPLFGQFNNVIAANAVEQLKQEVGTELLNEHADVLREAIAADREWFGQPEVRLQRMKQAVYAAAYERDRQTGGQPRNAQGQFVSPQQGDAFVEGGSGAAPTPQPGEKLSPEEQELADLQTWRRPVDEKGIPLPLG